MLQQITNFRKLKNLQTLQNPQKVIYYPVYLAAYSDYLFLQKQCGSHFYKAMVPNAKLQGSHIYDF